MKLSTRLVLAGALLPVVALVGTLVAVGLAMDRLLLAELDRSLLAQAAVESVSLFDRLAGPHLHGQESPLREQIATTSALYDSEGRLQAASPARSLVPPHLQPVVATGSPRLHTEISSLGKEFRVLEMTVSGPDRRPWALRLAVSLERHHAGQVAFFKAAALVGFLVALALLAAQLWQARLLHQRIEALASHMRLLRAGQLQAVPAPDPHRDVLAELRDLAADATLRLRAARDDQQRLVADAAHELRTPLAVLRTDIDVTLRRDRSAEELRETLIRVREESDRLGNLARQLLDLASVRAEVRERQPIDVAALLRSGLEPWQATALDKQLVLRSRLPAELNTRCDPAAVRQVLDNLLANAFDFAPAHTEVEVTLRVEAQQFVLQVRDHGPGVPPDQRIAVFAPFHRLNHQRQGSGLGLAIVRELTEQHGGRAWIEDAPDGGAIVSAAFDRS